MIRFSKAHFIFCLVGAYLLLFFVFERKLREITQWTTRNELFSKKMLNAASRRDHSRHLCVLFSGRLGNQMFIYASAYGIAHATNRTLVVIGNPLLKYFEGVSSDMDIMNCYWLSYIQEKKGSAFDPSVMALPDNNICLIGYLQSWMYFKNYSADIRRMFTFKKEILLIAKVTVEETKREFLKKSGVNASNLIIIGVHVRRGDMLIKEKSNLGYRSATLEYFFHAMDFFMRRFPNVLFVVCSDDVAWCYRNLQHNKNIRVVSTGLPEVDMAILSLCNHTISSTGSFSWWSAWLAGGETTYFAYPATEGSMLRNEYSKNYSDYFWPGWIPLS